MKNNLNFETIRKICIENDWYTCGTNEDFENLQDMVDSGKFDINDIVENIMLYSDDDIKYSEVKNIIEKYNNTKLTDTDKAKQIIKLCKENNWYYPRYAKLEHFLKQDDITMLDIADEIYYYTDDNVPINWESLICELQEIFG